MSSEVIVDLLQGGHAVQFQARGDSMHPFIREGDVLHVEPRREARVGDVVLAQVERGLTAHRVISFDATRVITRGDNADAPDAPLAPAQVLGVVTAVERQGKRLRARRSPVVVALVRWFRQVVRRAA
jgi:SOS-response transcriptional repressor LexA